MAVVLYLQAAESKAREEKVRERVRAIKQIKDAEAGNDTTAKAAEKVAWEKKVEEDAKDTEDTRKRSLAERFLLASDFISDHLSFFLQLYFF